MTNIVEFYLGKAAAFEREAHEILGKYESSRSRVLTVETTLAKLISLSVQQEELFLQALRCVEYNLPRAAIVTAWSAFMDFLENIIAYDKFVKIGIQYHKWPKFNSLEQLREYASEYQLIEAAQKIGIIGRSAKKSLHGDLSKRNECAHPSNYNPSTSESLGYINGLLNRITQMQDS